MRSRLSDLPFKRIGLLSLAILLCSLAFAKPDLLTRKPDTLANSQPMPNETSMPEAKLANNAPILPFEIQVSDAAIEDLQRRLAATRMPDQLRQTSWEYGTDSSYLAELLSYWRNDFDWREQERELNQFDQFKTVVADLSMHFIHQRSNNPDAIPLMVVHGWPGSVSEFSKIIGPLTDPLAYGGDISASVHVIAY